MERPVRKPRAVPRLLAITDRRSLGGPLEDWLRVAAPRVDAVALREKDLDDRALFALADRLRRAAPEPLLLVNGRADVAIASGADGVHLPANEVPTGALRRRFGSAFLIGRSTHHPEEVVRERRDGADYVTFGPVFPTPSKARYGPPPGLDGLRRAAACGLPVLALGGVGPDEMAAVAEAGAAGVAGIRAFQDPASLRRMAARRDELWPRS